MALGIRRFADQRRRDFLWAWKKFARVTGLNRQVYFEHRVAEYRALWSRLADDQGATFTDLASDLWQIEAAGDRVRIHNHELQFDDPVTLALAASKTTVHRLLASAGLAVPAHAAFRLGSLATARDFVAAHPQGSAVKPVHGYGGKGVTTHVGSPDRVRRPAILAAVYDRELMVEAMVPGEAYRLLVLEGRLVDAVVRRAPRLVGDGRTSVRRLITTENRRRAAAREPTIPIDADCRFSLAHQGLELDASPPSGRQFVVRYAGAGSARSSELRTAYTERATDLIGASVRDDAERAARIIGSDFLGVDVITTDPGSSLRDVGGAINEVNTTPALHHHYDSTTEPYPSVCVTVLETLLRRARDRRDRRASS